VHHVAFGTGTLVALGVLVWGAMVPPTGPVPVRIDMDAPAGCSDSILLFEAVHARTARARIAQEGEDAILVRVRLTRAGSRVRGELRVIDEQGETDSRRVEGSTCDEVVQALSLTAALAIDPSAILAPPPPSPPPPLPPPPQPSALPPEPPPEQPPQSSGLELGAEAMVAEVVSPRVSFGGAVYARWAWINGDVWNPSVGISVLYLRNDVFESATKAEVNFAAVALTGCPLAWRVGQAFHVEPCLLALGGSIMATGRSVAHPDRAERFWWSAGGSLRGGVSLMGGFGLVFEAGITAPLAKRRFVTTAPDRVVGETPPVSTLAAMGMAYRF
jgi:hypothetical protein